MNKAKINSLCFLSIFFFAFFGSSVNANYNGTWVTVYESPDPFGGNRKHVHQVDAKSISKVGDQVYFNRRVIHYRLENNEWVPGFLNPIGWGGSSVICRGRGTTFIGDAEGKGDYDFKQANGEWWSTDEIIAGYRAKASGVFLVMQRNSDKLSSGFHSFLC